MRLKNKGVTIIEMILVVAIIAMLTTGVAVLANHIAFADTQKTSRLIGSTLDKLRLETMTQDTRQYLYLYKVGTNVYMKVSEKDVAADAALDVASGTKIGRDMQVVYKETGGTDTELVPGASLMIYYKRSSGAFLSNYEFLTFNHAGRSAKILISKDTGRYEYE